jgi:hypothetical protein
MAAAILSIALAGYSQAQTTPAATPAASPSPTVSVTGTATTTGTTNPNAGTYKDTTLSIPQRIQLANAVLSSGTDATSVYSAANFMLSARPVINLMNAFPKFSASVMADPTLGAVISDTNKIGGLYLSAVLFNTGTTLALNDKVAYLEPFLSSTLLTPSQVLSVKSTYATLVIQQAQAQYANYDYEGAITTATPVLGWGCPQTIPLIFNSKVALRSSDVLSWAKLMYMVQDFSHSQAGIDAISSAFRCLDTNLVRANQFIAFQTSGTGTNPLAGVEIPTGVTFLGISPAVQALNYGMSGDYQDAIVTANTVFANAPSGPKLNNAVSLMAQWLRNKDGNLARSNQFVSAQTQGTSFNVVELSGTAGN